MEVPLKNNSLLVNKYHKLRYLSILFIKMSKNANIGLSFRPKNTSIFLNISVFT